MTFTCRYGALILTRCLFILIIRYLPSRFGGDRDSRKGRTRVPTNKEAYEKAAAEAVEYLMGHAVASLSQRADELGHWISHEG